MGEVYLAEHLSLEKPVALKILPLHLVSDDSVERFLREARTCSRIEHPNVVTIHDVGEQNRVNYIVMQYVQGKNLLELLQSEDGHLPWRSAMRLIQLAARGLHAVHSHGIIHRDIKPTNIMLSKDSRVLLMDFGLAREEFDSGLTRTGQVVGSPSFMSPEQCRGEPSDRRSDIYSLGSTFYCLLTGKTPFQGALQEVVAQIGGGKRPLPVHEVNQNVPPELSELVAKAMEPKADDRFDTAAIMTRDIKKLLQAAKVRGTSTYGTAEISAVAADTQSISELPEVELLPLETRWESLRGKLPMIGAAVIVSILLLVGLLLHFWGDGLDTSNMVFIDEGFAQLGISDDRLTAHFQSLPLLQGNDLAKQLSLLQAKQLASLEPQRRVLVSAFWIDRYEVTNAEYAVFVRETGHESPEGWDGSNPPSDKEGHPVHNVRHRDAEAYAEWAGKKLPTREQWMRAFRGDNDWLFPWGDQFDASRANVMENPGFTASTSPVTATPEDKSLFGVFNLVGNVCECLREQATIGGRAIDVAKGACFASLGQVQGMGPMSTRVQKGAAAPQLGFRCVVEVSDQSTAR